MNRYGTLGEAIERMAAVEPFVGRGFERSVFQAMLRDETAGTPRMLNVYGPGGIGKSALLARFREAAGEAGVRMAVIDMRDAANDPVLLLRETSARLGIEAASSPEALASLLRASAGDARCVIAFDRYEEAGELDAWIRERLLPSLPTNVIPVIAGRYRLSGPWSAPRWQGLMVRLALAELEYGEVCAYASAVGLADPAAADALWLETSGFPLSLPLQARLAVARRGKPRQLASESAEHSLDALLDTWLAETPDDDDRALLYAASVVRAFDLGLLQAITSRAWPESRFDRLVRLSFVRRGSNGWQLHDLVREIVRRSFRERLPETYAEQRSRAVERLRARVDGALARGERGAREIAELLYLTGNPILRAHFRYARVPGYYWEAATAETADEAERYVARRHAEAKPVRIACADPESSAAFRYELTADESLMRLRGWNVREVMAAAPDAIRLLRNAEGAVSGIAAVVPLRAFRGECPIPGPYSRMLERHGNGENVYYILGMDVEDMERIELRSSLVHLTLEYALSGCLLYSSPPPIPYYRDSHAATGYEAAGLLQDVLGTEPAIVYALDTRTPDRMRSFLNRMTASPDRAADPAQPEPDANAPAAAIKLTPRERDVAVLLVQGATNAEIASKLYVSEAAVKKYIQAMLQKASLRNRTQLAAMLLADGTFAHGEFRSE